MTESPVSKLTSTITAALHAESWGRPNLLWLIVCSALVLRLIEITEDSIWIDEAFANMTARLDLGPLWAQIKNDGLTPPLHYFLLSGWISVFGDSEFSTRSLSMLFGVASVWLIYELANVLAGRRVALISAFVLAVSSFHVHYAQEARTYTLVVCLSIASYFFFIKLLEQPDRRRALFYVLTSALLIYAHFFGVFVVLAQNVHMAILFSLSDNQVKLRFWAWCGIQTLLIVSILPLAILFAGGVERVGAGVWIENTFPPNLESLIELFAAFSGSLGGLVFVALLFCGAVVLWVRQRDSSDRLKAVATSHRGLLIGWLVVGIGAPFLISLAAQPILFPRYVIFISVPLFILMGMAIETFRARRLLHRGLIGVLVISGALQLAGFYAWNWNHFRFLRDWRSAGDTILETAQPDDLVLCSGNCGGLTYYLRNSDVAFRLSSGAFADRQTAVSAGEQLISSVKSYDRVFYVRPRRISVADEVSAALQREFLQGERKKARGLFIDVFQRSGTLQ